VDDDAGGMSSELLAESARLWEQQRSELISQIEELQAANSSLRGACG
jgi:hypothetical protein